MEKCVIDFQNRSDWEYATRQAQSMGIKPWDIVAKKCLRFDAYYTLIVYFYNKKQVQAFLEFLVSEHNVKLNDIKIHQRKKWKEKRK
jgi:hypothetical protein